MAESFEEKQILSAAANLLRGKLISHVVGPIRFRSNVALDEDESIDGWWAIIATVDDPAIDISVWLDTYARRANRCFWIGFSAKRKNAVSRLIKVLKEVPPILLSKDINMDTNEPYWQMKVALRPNLFGRPVQEDYRGEHYLGIYYGEPPKDDNKFNINIENSAKWLMEILSLIGNFTCDGEADHYSAEENRLQVSFHLRRERDPTLARLCKERDGYRCRVCEVKLDEVYGDLAEGFAEAHHIVPLSNIDGQVDRDVNHLATVCANCHRMLHRLKGNESDLDELRLRYLSAKKNQAG